MAAYKKAITFSYDDGVTQDKRLVALFNKYGVKATFNINSQLLGQNGALEINGKSIMHNKINPDEIKTVYAGHEIAVHTLTHPLLTKLGEEDIIHQVEDDRKMLCTLSGQNVVGMAYPCGGQNYDTRVADIVRSKTGVKYSRTIISNYSFEKQSNLFEFKPTVHHTQTKELNQLADRFLSLSASAPALFYIWGHSYEFDIEDTWNDFELFLQKISGKPDIFYGTNSQCLLP